MTFFNYVNTKDSPCDGFTISLVTKRFPIFSYVPPTKDEINSILLPLIEQYRKENPETITTNVVTNWRSGWKVQNDSRFSFFVEWISQQISFLSGNYLRRNYLFKCTDMWLMQYEDGDYAQAHDHFPSAFSCVYYADVEEGCSSILFEDKQEIVPENGMIVVFPSVLMHEVVPTKNKRTVVSMNFEVSGRFEKDEDWHNRHSKYESIMLP